jgi:Na+/H+ antiporter NhaC
VTVPAQPVPLRFIGGTAGALTPLAVFLAGAAWLAAQGAPDERGFWPVLLAALAAGWLLTRERGRYAEAVIAGMAQSVVLLMITAWLLAGALSSVLAASGFVDALVWCARTIDVRGGGYAVAAFLACAVVSTSTGTSFGTILICGPLLYPAGAGAGVHPAALLGAILGGATFGDSISPVSDTTIASAGTQGADIAGTVRARLKYVLPAGAVAMAAAFVLGGMSGVTVDAVGPPSGDPRGLPMAAVPIAVVAMLLAGRHLVEALMVGLVAAIDARRRLQDVAARRPVALGATGAELRIVAWLTAAIVLTTHSVVAILAVGPYAAQVGGQSGLGPYRRANLLDLTACTWPFVLPFFLPTILAAGTTVQAGAMPRLSPADAGLYNAYSWTLVAIVGWAIAVGFGRGEGPAAVTPGEPGQDAGAK